MSGAPLDDERDRSPAEPPPPPAPSAGDMLRGVGLRVWAELGRARLPIGSAVGLAPGAVLELDRAADDLVDLYVNGRRFACGRLLLADDGEWAVHIEEIEPPLARSSVDWPGGWRPRRPHPAAESS